MAETREERLARLKEEREAKLQEMAAARLSARAAAIDPEAAKYYGVTSAPVAVGATTQERVEALREIRAAENLATYSAAEEFKAIPYSKLDPQTKGVIKANAAAQGVTPEQYLESRGGVNASGYFGDSYSAGITLTEREYQIARLEGGIGTTGAGEAINIASAKKAYDYYISQGQTPEQASASSGYNPKTGLLTSFSPSGSPTDSFKGSGTTGDPLIYNGAPFTGTRNGARYVSGVLQVDSSGNKGGNYTGNGTVNNPLSLNGVPFTGVLNGINYTNGIAQKSDSPSGSLTTADIETKARRTAQQDFKAALGELGLADLADEVDRMIRQDFTVAQIKMELPKTQSYQLRFPGMEALRKAGRAISEATYISNERGYLQTLRAYGLDTSVLGSRSELGKYIQNEVSPREFEERVNLAATRVKENPDVTAAFKSFYPEVDESGVIAYLLNPTKGMDIIRKQIRISEIGAASQVAGFGKDIMGVDQAAALISAVGETGYGALRTEFQRARQLAMSQRRLAQIEGQQYTDLEAIGAVVGDDVTKMLASERRAQREVARFSGTGGLTAGSLRETAI